MGEETARKLGQRAKEAGIVLSLHAPYFINLANPDPESLQKTIGYITAACLAADQMGAGRVIVHSGALMKRSRREALDIARKRADVILTTGGLGPTYDDLTKQTVCETFGKPLVLREDVLEHIRTYFARNVHLTMPKNNRQQAEFPADCVIFDNSVGTAPGCAFEAEGVHVLMLPGPPFEMRTMLQNWAVPYLRGLSKEVIVSHDIMTFGLGESPMEDLMRERISRMENPSLATYAKPSEVRLRATAKADSAAAAEDMLVPVVRKVTDYLGDVVYGVDVPNLETVCMTHLKEKGWTFATAESCTGGQISARITALSGASSVYRGGVVSYWTSVKAEVLGVSQTLLDQYGAVSEECARSMAENARRITGADIGLSVTGVAGPDLILCLSY